MQIQKVVSPKGVEAWLVEDHTLPLIAMQFGFKGGSSQDPANKEGLAYFVSGTLDEGAGDIRSQEFQELLEGQAIEIGFEASRDVLTGGVKTLTKNKDEAFRLLGLVLSQPRMDQDAVDRVREQIFTLIKTDNEDPDQVASSAWFAQVFAGHPYAVPTKGDATTVASITPEDLKGYVKRNFARDNLYVSVVGDIDAAELAQRLDGIFGALPAKAELKPIPEAVWHTEPRSKIIPMAMPQSVVMFGQPGPKRKDEDFMAAYILNYIIGGGGFASLLMEEVREKRGLAYSVYTYLYPLERAGILLGGVATENKSVGESLEVIKKTLNRIATDGPTQAELDDAKRYLTGSYALRFSSSQSIAQIVLWQQIEDLGIDYIDKRNALVEAVTMADIKRAAKIIKPDDMVITIVGQPEGLTSTGEKPAAPASLPRG
ncbi:MULTISPECIES: pitrilysin family protein [Rhodomicrobium]|uniref:M16 family metallopeptidase n=1 Tax=Rhodomicrobium TaxID=1068 RepID=UPI001FDA54CC|nr:MULTISPECIES: pitrilysin family protein [Rhodomicrobium]